MNNSSNYQASTSDWRTQLRKNQLKTRWVIFLFVAVYTLIGMVVDLYLYSHFYYQVPVAQIIYAIVTLKLVPYATLIMGGIAVISLWVTYALYDKIMLLGTNSREITPETAQGLQEKQLYNVVEEMKVAAGLKYMPKVYIIEADYMNAFATGYSEKSALVAITRGLMVKLDRSEMQAVMAHELSHIRHQDIKLTLTASVLSNIMIIVVDLLFYNVVFGSRRRTDSRLAMAILILRFILPIISILLMLYLSRTREYMADSGCVELMRDNKPLASALIKINDDHRQNSEAYKAQYGATAHENVRRAAYLYDPVSSGVEPVMTFTNLFSTHPNLQQRLNAIGIHEEENA